MGRVVMTMVGIMNIYIMNMNQRKETNNGTTDNGPEEFGIDYGVGHENGTASGDDSEWYWHYFYSDDEGDGKNGSETGAKEYGGDYGVGHENNTDVWYWYTYPEGEGEGENTGKNKTEDGEDYGVGHENEEGQYEYDYTYEYEETTTTRPKKNEKGNSGSDYMDLFNSKPRKQKHFGKSTSTKATTTTKKNDTNVFDPINKEFPFSF